MFFILIGIFQLQCIKTVLSVMIFNLLLVVIFIVMMVMYSYPSRHAGLQAVHKSDVLRVSVSVSKPLVVCFRLD